MPFLQGDQPYVHDEEYVFRVEQSGHLLIRKGDWKLVNEGYPLDTANFKVYDLAADQIEGEDLSTSAPAMRAEMMDLWLAYKEEARILDENEEGS